MVHQNLVGQPGSGVSITLRVWIDYRELQEHLMQVALRSPELYFMRTEQRFLFLTFGTM
jgi:hypothetical protein